MAFVFVCCAGFYGLIPPPDRDSKLWKYYRGNFGGIRFYFSIHSISPPRDRYDLLRPIHKSSLYARKKQDKIPYRRASFTAASYVMTYRLPFAPLFSISHARFFRRRHDDRIRWHCTRNRACTSRTKSALQSFARFI